MSTRPLTRDEVRSVDQRAIVDFEMPGVVLMENAGRGAVSLMESLGISGPIAICAGRGNNGGDGFVMARHLQNHGHDVQVLVCGNPSDLRGDALINFKVIEHAGITLTQLGDLHGGVAGFLSGADWIVDALLGTGASGPVRKPLDEVIEAINSSPARVLAVDLPSGLNCDTGETHNICVRADQTATFVAPKIGFTRGDAPEFLGDVHVVEIGVPRRLLMEFSNERK